MSDPTAWLVEPAPAKINLYLHVLGRRTTGFHDLDSLAVFTDIGDRIEVKPAPALTLTVAGRFADALSQEPVADNLVWRAATGLAGRLGRNPAVAITLVKDLPVASGIGGGSSDAAATLRALARLWAVPADAVLLRDLAAELGSDVPVCLAGATRFFGGTGDRLDPAPRLPETAIVLANPGLPLSTPAVFRARSGAFSLAGRFDAAPADAAALAAVLASRRNDLAPAAIGLMPVIATVLEALHATSDCLLARLSGSGPTCFALFPSAAAAATAAETLAAAYPSWWVRAGRLI